MIGEWLDSDCANVRRAVSERVRVWTSRPYFRDHPQAAIDLLAAHKYDANEHVRRSIGNAICDIGKEAETQMGLRFPFLKYYCALPLLNRGESVSA